QALAAVGIHPGFGDVGKKCRREINKMEAHAMHMPAVVLAGEPVSRFVEEEHEAGEQPEFRNIVKTLFGEVVKLQGVAADLVPAASCTTIPWRRDCRPCRESPVRRSECQSDRKTDRKSPDKTARHRRAGAVATVAAEIDTARFCRR